MKTLLCTYFTMYLEDKGLPSSDITYSFADIDIAKGMAFYGRLSDDTAKTFAQQLLNQGDAHLVSQAIDKGVYLSICDSSMKPSDGTRHQACNMAVVPTIPTSTRASGDMLAPTLVLRNMLVDIVRDIAITLSEHGRLIIETGQHKKAENSVRRMKETARSIMDTLAA